MVKWKLTINATSGGTTSPAPGTYEYDDGTNVTVTAIPNTGYHFVKWEIVLPSGEIIESRVNPATLVMWANYSITAFFESEAPRPGPVTLFGRVVDSILKLPVAYPLVTLTAEGYSGERIGSNNGYYEFRDIPVNRNYTLTVEKTGYKTFSTSFYIDEVDVEKNVELEPIGVPPDRGMLDIHAYMNSNEITADVEVKDMLVPPKIDVKGKTPFQVLLIPQGYEVICRYNYELGKYVNLEAGKTVRVDFQFHPIVPRKPIIDVYAIYIDQQVEADVTCDSYYSKTPARFEVEPGTYTIKVTYRGKTHVEQVTVDYGDYAELFIQLATGMLECHVYADSNEVCTKVPNVYVVGKGWFKTPFTAELEIGRYVVNAHYANQTPQSKVVEIFLDQTTRVDFQFEKTMVPVELTQLATALVAIASGSVMLFATMRKP